ncbi:MAG: hypothetical protein KKB39_00365 [Nanoarchaeota archaeon]|nr:hypothetical protein [Nanoarchaeota archaeon]
MIFKKKGISPLIATVLIIGFTVALAAIIMTWGTTFSKSMQKGSEEQANLQMVCAQDVQYTLSAACYFNDTGAIRVTVKNDGSIDLVDMTARLFTSPSNVEAKMLNKTGDYVLEKYDIGVFDVVLTTVTAEEVRMVEIVPVIEVGGKQVTCAQTVEQYGDALGTKLDPCV